MPIGVSEKPDAKAIEINAEASDSHLTSLKNKSIISFFAAQTQVFSEPLFNNETTDKCGHLIIECKANRQQVGLPQGG
jgi:hypothetical protein